MRSSMQRPASPRAAAAGHPPAIPLTVARDTSGRAPELTADEAGLNLVRCYLPHGLSLGTDAVAEVSR
jgi:hypothetical protein